MALAEKNIRFFLSGGAGNSDPKASLGGEMSTTELKTKNASKDTNNITGVVLRDVSGDCPDGATGQLDYTAAGTLLKFKKPGGTLGAGVDVSANGVYQVYDDDGAVFAIVEVTAASLPVGNEQDTVTVAGPLHYLFDAIKKSENWYGDEEHRCIFVANDQEEETGTVTSAAAATLTDTAQSWVVDEHMGRFVYVYSGIGAGQVRLIESNTADTLTVSPDWGTTPEADDLFVIFNLYFDANLIIETESEGELDSGTATAGAATTLVDSGQPWTVDVYANKFVRIISGTGAGQSRQIVSNTDTTLTINPAWSVNPASGSVYSITDNVLDLGLEACQITAEAIDSGDGGQIYGGTLEHFPLVEGTLVITDALGQETFTDYEGTGTLAGSAGGSGTINYATGVWTLDYNANLAVSTAILANYVKWPQEIADENTAPTGVTFVHPVAGAVLTIGDLYGSQYPVRWGAKAIWLKWRVRKAAERDPATAVVQISGQG